MLKQTFEHKVWEVSYNQNVALDDESRQNKLLEYFISINAIPEDTRKATDVWEEIKTNPIISNPMSVGDQRIQAFMAVFHCRISVCERTFQRN